MAKLNRGILGGVSGTIGPVCGSTWRGVEYIRSLPKTSNSDPTAEQVEQRSRFALAIRFVTALKHLFAITYRSSAKQMTETNVALAAVLKNAVSGAHPNHVLNYAMVQVSQGKVPNAAGPTAAPGVNTVNFSWTDNTGMGSAARANDKAILVAYSPSMNHCVFSTGAAVRSSGSGTLSVPEFSGQTVETWIAFIADIGRDTAPSLYTGAIAIP
jgi:hypothetical protein